MRIIRIPKILLFLFPTSLMLFLPAWCLLTWGLHVQQASYFLMGLSGGYVYFDMFHHMEHTKRVNQIPFRWLQKIWAFHSVHHRIDQSNFGVTTSFWTTFSELTSNKSSAGSRERSRSKRARVRSIRKAQGASMRRFCLGLAAAAALALGSGAPQASAQTPETVRVAAFPLDATGNLYYAYDLGLFQKAGLDVQFVTVTSGAVVGEAVASGTIDIGTTNVVSIALAHQSGLPFVIIAPSGASSAASPLEAIVVAKNSPYKTAKDLEGKTAVTTVLQGILQTEADADDKHHADPRSVKWIEARAPAQAAVIESGRVDFGAIPMEPFVTAAVNGGNSRVLGYIGPEVSRLLVEGGYFCTADYAKLHPDTVKKFRAALMEAGRWATRIPTTRRRCSPSTRRARRRRAPTARSSSTASGRRIFSR